MGDAKSLIRKYRGKGVFVDTNLLVLLVVGSVNEHRIADFKRTSDYSVEDYRKLKRLLAGFGAPLSATPHVLSQVSDLTTLPGEELAASRRVLRELVTTVEECALSSRDLVQHAMFRRFGLADASVSAACEQQRLVLTADVKLYIALVTAGLDAINFNHVRPLSA